MGKKDQSVKWVRFMYLFALVPFFVFLTNVLLGSFLHKPYLGDVGEMISLFLSSVGFVIIVLKEESMFRENASAERSEQ